MLLAVAGSVLRADPSLLMREMFGQASVMVFAESPDEQLAIARLIGGQLTAAYDEPEEDVSDLVETLSEHAGLVIWNGWPTGVAVSYAQQHGGPFPATTAPSATSVGTAAIARFLRAVAYQDLPDKSLPPALRSDNPWRIVRRVDG